MPTWTSALAVHVPRTLVMQATQFRRGASAAHVPRTLCRNHPHCPGNVEQRCKSTGWHDGCAVTSTPRATSAQAQLGIGHVLTVCIAAHSTKTKKNKSTPRATSVLDQSSTGQFAECLHRSAWYMNELKFTPRATSVLAQSGTGQFADRVHRSV